MSEIEEFSQRLKELRKRARLSQTELADRVKVSLLTVFRWEKGIRTPRIEEMRKLCEVLGCNESELLNGPEDGKIKITLVYDWDKMKEGKIDMNGNDFELILGSNGQIGLKGAGQITSRAAIDEFLAQVKEQLMIAFDAQIKRGAIQEV